MRRMLKSKKIRITDQIKKNEQEKHTKQQHFAYDDGEATSWAHKDGEKDGTIETTVQCSLYFCIIRIILIQPSIHLPVFLPSFPLLPFPCGSLFSCGFRLSEM